MAPSRRRQLQALVRQRRHEPILARLTVASKATKSGRKTSPSPMAARARWLPSRLIPHRHRPRAELQPAHELQVDTQPRLAGHGPTLFAGLSKRVDLKLVGRLEFGSGAVAMR